MNGLNNNQADEPDPNNEADEPEPYSDSDEHNPNIDPQDTYPYRLAWYPVRGIEAHALTELEQTALVQSVCGRDQYLSLVNENPGIIETTIEYAGMTRVHLHCFG